MPVDFGKTALDYSRHRAGFPEAFFERIAAFEVGLPNQRLLDLGTGTGTLARGFARRGCQVIGLDPAAALIEQAKRLDQAAGVVVDYIVGKAEKTSFPATSFDVVTAGQCWHWFNRPQAAQEARRLLMPEGKLVIAHFDWIPLPGNVVAATENLILQHNPAWKNFAGGTGLHPAWLADVAIAGFVHIETFSFDVPVFYSHEAWRGRIRASAGVAAALPPEQVRQFDIELAQLLVEKFPADPLETPHRVFGLTCQSPG